MADDLFNVNECIMDGRALSKFKWDDRERSVTIKKIGVEEPMSHWADFFYHMDSRSSEIFMQEGLGSRVAVRNGNMTRVGLVRLKMVGVGSRDARRLVKMATNLRELELSHMTLPTLNWIPRSVKVLTIESCAVEQWDCHRCGARTLYITNTELSRVFPIFGKIFPKAIWILLEGNCIKTLGGVLFPRHAQVLIIHRNHGLSVSGAEFPPSLNTLTLQRCHGLKGFHAIKFPPNLERLSISGCGLGWIGEHLDLPPTLKLVFATNNPDFDPRSFADVSTSHDREFNSIPSTHYRHDDAVCAMIRKKVLPHDLLRTLRVKFLRFGSFW